MIEIKRIKWIVAFIKEDISLEYKWFLYGDWYDALTDYICVSCHGAILEDDYLCSNCCDKIINMAILGAVFEGMRKGFTANEVR